MANELNIQLDPFSDSGLTLIAKGFNPNGTQLGSDVTMTEVGSRAYYTASFSLTSVPDGAYLISFETATDFYGQGVLYVKDGNELDLSDIETEVLATVRETNIINEVNDNEVKIDAIDTNVDSILVGTLITIPNLINALNDLSESQVKAQADQALIDYDSPTKSELDSVETVILNAVSGLNNLTQQEVAEAVWDYLQSSTTVSTSMKEAVEKILINANLIPASI